MQGTIRPRIVHCGGRVSEGACCGLAGLVVALLLLLTGAPVLAEDKVEKKKPKSA